MVGGLQEIWKMKECWHHGPYPQTLLVTHVRNLQEKWYRGSIVSLLTSRKTEVAKFVREPRLQVLAGNALVMQYPEPYTW